MGVRVPWIDRDRAAVGVDCRLQPAGRLQDDAEVAVAVGPIGLEREALLDQRDGFVAAPLLVREHAGVVQRAGVIRRRLEHAAEQFAGCGELVVLLQQDCELDRLVQRQLARRRLFLLNDPPEQILHRSPTVGR